MPRKMHKALDKSARRLGLKKGTKSYGKYVFGTMSKKKGKKCGK
jgi:hypothetical protein